MRKFTEGEREEKGREWREREKEWGGRRER